VQAGSRHAPMPTLVCSPSTPPWSAAPRAGPSPSRYSHVGVFL